MTRKEEIGPRSGRAGPSFSVRPEKEAKGAVLHGTSAAERLRHVKKVRRTFPNSTPHGVSHTWQGSFLPLPCAAGAKIPSRATQNRCCVRCLGLPAAHAAHMRKMPVRKRSETTLFCALFLLLDFSRQAGKGATRPFGFLVMVFCERSKENILHILIDFCCFIGSTVPAELSHAIFIWISDKKNALRRHVFCRLV